MSTCKICNTPFDDWLHRDCGGDCLLCMAKAGDTGCALAVADLALSMERSIVRQKQSLQDHIDTNIELRARVRELEDRLYKEGIDS